MSFKLVTPINKPALNILERMKRVIKFEKVAELVEENDGKCISLISWKKSQPKFLKSLGDVLNHPKPIPNPIESKL